MYCSLMMYLFLEIKERVMEDLRSIKDVLEGKGDDHNKLEAESNSTSSPTWSPGPVHIQIDTHDASELRF